MEEKKEDPGKRIDPNSDEFRNHFRGHLKLPIGPISERLSWGIIVKYANDLLNKYPTTLK